LSVSEIPHVTGWTIKATSPACAGNIVVRMGRLPPRRRRRAAWRWVAAGLAAGALGLLLAWGRPSPGPWSNERTRRLEARLDTLGLDVHQPFDAQRAATEPRRPSYGALAALEKKGHIKELVSGLLVEGETAHARTLLAASKDPELDNERAVAALVSRQPEEGLRFADRVLRREPTSRAAKWNAALALRELGLGYAAVASFREVEALAEPGWSGEARRWADSLAEQTAARRSRYENAEAQARRLSDERQLPNPATIERFPDLMRVHLYQALRTAHSRDDVKALAPVARALDSHYGGTHLTNAIERLASLDFQQRRPLVAAYTALKARSWRTDAAALDAYRAQLIAAGAVGRDLLAGSYLDGLRTAALQAEVERMVKDESDPWISLALIKVAASADHDTAPSGSQEKLLREAVGRARQHGFDLLRLPLQIDLGYLLLRQQRPVAADPLVHETLQAAHTLGLWTTEMAAVAQLATLASYRQEPASVNAYSREVLLAGATCETQILLEGRVAERAAYEGRLDEARAALARLDGCAQERPLRLPGIVALSELVRADHSRSGLARLHGEVERFCAGPPGGPAPSRIDILSARNLEARAIVEFDRIAGRGLLRDTIARIEDGGDTRELGLPRLAAYRRLVADLVKTGELPEALRLMAAEARVRLPSGCVVGISEELRKATVVVRTADGAHLTAFGHPALGEQPDTVVPANLRASLRGCAEVAVIALSPFRGKPRLLPPEMVWRHHSRELPEQGPWTPTHRVVVSDVTPPPSFNLPVLPPWQGARSGAIARHLRGPEATPDAVVEELKDADLFEFHVHGLVDFRLAEAPFLVLSEGLDGRATLDAETVRALRLRRQPFVVLAACNSAASSPYLPSSSGRWGLTAAFLEAGARAVVAANVPIPDGAASQLVEDLIERMQGGASPAHALRDARMTQLASPGHDWAEDFVLFQ
jgi:hypothetical protein